jgi:hypothetical protein
MNSMQIRPRRAAHLKAAVIATLILATTAALSPAVGSAQMTASQGVAPVAGNSAPADAQYHSPMVVTIAFPPDARGLWGNGKWTDPGTFQQLRDFRCDGIDISDMQALSILKSNGKIMVQIKGKFDSTRGHDKRVDMKLEFLSDGAVIRVGYAEKLKAPERKEMPFNFEWGFPAGQVQDRTPTHLRITFSDYDD